jgi:hypothetical protein
VLKSIAALLALGVSLCASLAQAQTETLYVTDGDSARLAIVRGGVLLAVKTTHVRGYPLTATSSLWIGDYDGTQLNSIQYDLGGNATGATVPYTVRDAVDGASDGRNAWQLGPAFSTSATVWFSPSVDFSGSVAAFSVAGDDLVGIAFDTATGTLWVSDQNNIYHYSTGGTLLGQFAHTSGRGCIAYEHSTDTLWYVSNGSDNITQYSKTGAKLQTLTVAGLSSNNWGAEFSAVVTPPPVPTLSQWALFLLAALMVLLGGSAVLKRSA